MSESDIVGVISEINAKLDAIEEHMAWLLRADQRFVVGDKVELSRKARRRFVVPKTRHDRKGRVKRIANVFSIVVQLDGYKRPITFHHSFFNRVRGPKLF
jgi:putative ribosome biogenesis GTPase RsgA